MLLLVQTACNKEDLAQEEAHILAIAQESAKTPVSPADLPMGVQGYLEEVHFETFVDQAFEAPEFGFEVITAGQDHLFFDRQGRLLMEPGELFERPALRRFVGTCGRPGRYLSPRELPEAVQQWIGDEYPDLSPARAKLSANGELLVGMARSPLLLVFSPEGRFLEEAYCFRTCLSNCAQTRPVELPEAIVAYVREHQSGAEVLAAYHCRGGNYVVGLFVGGARLVLVFDHRGQLRYARR